MGQGGYITNKIGMYLYGFVQDCSIPKNDQNYQKLPFEHRK